jgi:small ligand-binding sensory domain FIST
MSTEQGYAAAVALSGHLDTRTAAMEVGDQLYDELVGDCHLLLMFASFHHHAAFREATEHLRQTLSPDVTLGVTAEAVLGADEEREGRAGLSAIALRMDGVKLHPWEVTPASPLDPENKPDIRERLSVGEELKSIVVLADPFSTPMPKMLPALTSVASAPIVGGLASGASQPGHNALALDDQIVTEGAVGVSISGPVQVDTIVSQGCRAIGDPVVITKAHQNFIHELGGQPPMAVLKEITTELDEDDRQLLNRGLLVGVVINEYKSHHGRGDFLVRNVTALDRKTGSIAVGDQLRVGQTIQFHIRDAATATEDLQLLLDKQQLEEPPFAGLLFTCNSRGTRLFPEPNHDVKNISQRLGQLPVSGFFAAGEIGPIGTHSFVHGHTASVALLRRP